MTRRARKVTGTPVAKRMSRFLMPERWEAQTDDTETLVNCVTGHICRNMLMSKCMCTYIHARTHARTTSIVFYSLYVCPFLCFRTVHWRIVLHSSTILLFSAFYGMDASVCCVWSCTVLHSSGVCIFTVCVLGECGCSCDGSLMLIWGVTRECVALYDLSGCVLIWNGFIYLGYCICNPLGTSRCINQLLH